MKKYFLMIIFLLQASFVLGQTNDALARQKYQKAKDAFAKENYSECINNLYNVEDILGNTNIKVLPLLIKSYDALMAWSYVVKDFHRYESLKPDTTLIEYIEINDLNNKALQKLISDSADYKNLCKNVTISNCDNYLSKYPYGIFRDDVNWNRANKENYLESYYNYIDNYPKGKYYSDAMQKINKADLQAYDKATNQGTQSSLNYYLTYFPRGKYRNEVAQKIRERKEYDLYIEVLSSKNYLEYLNKYPKGKYSEELNLKLGENYLLLADLYFKNRDFENANQLYQKYINLYPDGEKSKLTNDLIVKCNKYQKRNNIEAVTICFEPKEYTFGIGYEKYDFLKLKSFYQFRMNPYGIAEADENLDLLNETSITHKGVISISGGVNYCLLYPLWVEVGIGAGYFPVFIEMSDNSSLKIDKEKSSFGIFPQTGLSLKISKKIAIKYSVNYYKDLYHQFGIGIGGIY